LASASHTVDELLTQAEAARDQGSSAEALARGGAAAEAAWPQIAADDRARRRRGGLLLVHFRYRSGALSSAVDAGLEILPLLRETGPDAELVELLRTIALCAVDAHRFDDALHCAEEAHRVAQALGDPGWLSLATNTLGCFFERSGDPWQAERLLNEAVDIARPLAGPWRPLFGALNNLAAVLIGAHYLLRDAVPLEEARAPLQRALPAVQEAVAQARQLQDPFALVFVLGNLGEILVHLGNASGARAALEEAMAGARAGGYEAQMHRIGCSLGELLVLEGHPGPARDALAAVLSALLAAAPAADQPVTRLRLHHALWRAESALQRPAAALSHLEQYLKLERQRAVTQLQSQSRLFVTRLEAEQARLEARRQGERADTLEVDVRHDPLTGLGNRREVAHRWPEMLRHAQAADSPLSVAMVDLDMFKQVNDRHGHALGDRVLVALAQLLRAATRSADLVARVGGEEFLLLLPDTPPQRALEVCERLRQRVASYAWSNLAQDLKVTLSIGVASTPPLDAAALTRRADEALFRAKAQGRDRVVAG